MRTRGVVLLSIGLLVVSVAGAQEDTLILSELPDWGTEHFSFYTLHAFGFVPIDSSTTYSFTNWMRFITGGYPALVSQLHLPTGARVDEIFYAVCDESASQNLQLQLWRCPQSPFTPPCTQIHVVQSIGLNGCNLLQSSTGLPFTIENVFYSYFVEFNGYSGDSSHRLDAAMFKYRLQVSPPPASATFTDVPTDHQFFQYIEALAASGITAGCGGGNYCPNAPLTRGQMAVFLSKALGLFWWL